MQPPFTKWLPVALMVGVLAGLSVWASLQLGAAYGAWIAAPWAMFISWGLYFMAGAKVSRMHKYFYGLTGGIVFGALTLVVADVMTGVAGEVWGLPLTVFLAATLIVLLELTDWFELAPAYFFTFAGYFAYVSTGAAGDANIYMAALYYWVLTLAGLALGFVSAWLKGKIFDFQGVPAEQRNTVFDREAHS